MKKEGSKHKKALSCKSAGKWCENMVFALRTPTYRHYSERDTQSQRLIHTLDSIMASITKNDGKNYLHSLPASIRTPSFLLYLSAVATKNFALKFNDLPKDESIVVDTQKVK